MSFKKSGYLILAFIAGTAIAFGFAFPNVEKLRKYRDYILIEDFNNKSLNLLNINNNDQTQYPCYVRVGSFQNKENTKPVEKAEVYVLVRKENTSNSYAYYGWGNDYLGYRKTLTNSSGFTCVPTLCKTEALIFVQKDGQRLTALPEYLPRNYFYRTQTRNEEIVIAPRDRGIFLRKSGPVYHESEHTLCTTATKDNSWYISFAFLSIPDSLHAEESKPHLNNSWYYSSPEEPSFKACFLKVLVKTTSYSVKITATSKSADNNELYGTYTTGPKPKPGSKDSKNRAACVEYRCPIDSGVVVNVTVTDPTFQCTSTSSSLPTEVKRDRNTFQLTLNARDNNRPADGIYVAFKSVLLGKQMCTAGLTDIENNFKFNATLNTLIEFSCMVPNTAFG